jgi:hypothetical protein
MKSLPTRDVDIRRSLLGEMKQLHQDSATRIVEELGLCQGFARVDIAVVNGRLHGYEIKSEHDTLGRLPSQADIYNRTLDLVTIVSAPNHVDKIKALVPPWWGIRIAIRDEEGVYLSESREPKSNPDIDPFSLAQLLWRDEALKVLVDRDMAAGLRSRPRQDLWRRLASNLTLEDLGDVVRERLKCRGADWRAPSQRALHDDLCPPSAT